jgi:AcrR family transcriptional regulator
MVAGGAVTSRRERRKLEVRRRIVEAAEGLFAEQGFEGTTVDQIAELADVAQKTFFNHFPTKHDLLVLLANERLERLHSELEEVRRRALPTARKLELFFARGARHIEEEDLLARDVSRELQRLLSSESDAAGAEASKLSGLFAAILRDGQAAGDVRDDRDADFLAEMALGVYSAVMLNWASGVSYPVRRRLAQAASFLGEALAPRDATRAPARRRAARRRSS